MVEQRGMKEKQTSLVFVTVRLEERPGEEIREVWRNSLVTNPPDKSLSLEHLHTQMDVLRWAEHKLRWASTQTRDKSV